MKTNRKPLYEGASYRIVSCPGGLWQLQCRVSESRRDHDPWQPLARPTRYELAVDQLSRARIVKLGVAFDA
jgi:hypothetical protein